VLRLRELRRLSELTHECRDLGDDTFAWRQHFAAGVARLVGADLMIGGELADFARGRPRSLGGYSWGVEQGFNLTGWRRMVASLEYSPCYALEMVNYGRRLRDEDGPALSGQDLVDPRVRVRTVEYELYRVMGVEQVMWCARRLPVAPQETF